VIFESENLSHLFPTSRVPYRSPVAGLIATMFTSDRSGRLLSLLGTGSAPGRSDVSPVPVRGFSSREQGVRPTRDADEHSGRQRSASPADSSRRCREPRGSLRNLHPTARYCPASPDSSHATPADRSTANAEPKLTIFR
jgi:hypothetical protein